MIAQSNPRLVAQFKSVSEGAALALCAIGSATLVGWIFGIAILKSVLPGLVTMKANTAVAFVLISVSLWLLQTKRAERRALRSVAQGCAGIVALLGLLTLSEYLFGWESGIDQLLFKEAPGAAMTSYLGRMAPNTALNFLISGLALLLLDMETRHDHRPAQFLTLVVGALAVLALVGYIYGSSLLYGGVADFTAMAPHTAAAFGLVSIGILCARPDRGFMALPASQGMGGRLARRLLLAGIWFQFGLNALTLLGEGAGLYDSNTESALHMVLIIGIGAFFVLATAGSLEKVDVARKQAEKQIRQQLETLTALNAGAQRLAISLEVQKLADDAMRTCVEVFGAQLAWIGRAEPDGRVRLLAQFPAEIDYLRRITVRWDDTPAGRGPTGQAIRSGAPVVRADLSGDSSFLPWKTAAAQYGFTSAAALPLASPQRSFGALLVYSRQAGYFTAERVQFLQSYALQLAAALENARLFEQTERRLSHMQALRKIDLAITASFDLHVTLDIILDQAITHLHVDAAAILVFEPRTRMLSYAAGQGFRSSAIKASRVRLGEGLAGRAALEGQSVFVENLHETKGEIIRSFLVADEEFSAYYGVPLISKGQVRGVLEIFQRSALDPHEEWLNFLEAIAEQTAIALDNTTLFENMQRSNLELELAYDTTLEGWSRALELRDHETEGHTQRVTEITVKLARALGLDEDIIAHIRRGSLLHDIGKMGIPDSILLKPGSLTEEEWVIMRRHPQFAYDMLAQISYLQPALDIPYCHHEKWDGTGYPRGLKGAVIPLAARIFAVVDVWDALLSDRPYRKAWPEDRARAYLLDQAGKHFDPHMVELFMHTIPA